MNNYLVMCVHMYRLLGVMHAQLQKPSNYTSIPITCSTSREPLKTSKTDRIQQSPWRPATLAPLCLLNSKFIVYWCYGSGAGTCSAIPDQARLAHLRYLSMRQLHASCFLPQLCIVVIETLLLCLPFQALKLALVTIGLVNQKLCFYLIILLINLFII